MNNTTSIKAHKITFPEELYGFMQLKTRKLGISVPEYIRHLIVNDVENIQSEIASPELEEKIGTGLRDINNDRYIVIKDKEELKKFLDTL